MGEYPYKQAFREACRARGIDPGEGANSFQVVDYLTCEAVRTHHERAAARVVAHAERCPINYASGYLEADAVTVADRASRSWWQNALYWHGGTQLSTFKFRNTPYEVFTINGQVEMPTEMAAVRNVRDDAKALEAVRIRRLQAERWQQWRCLVKEVMVEARQAVMSVSRG